MSGTNAAIERVFSITDGQNNRFLIPTIKIIIILKNHLKKYSCNELYDYMLTQSKPLNAISSS